MELSLYGFEDSEYQICVSVEFYNKYILQKVV